METGRELSAPTLGGQGRLTERISLKPLNALSQLRAVLTSEMKLAQVFESAIAVTWLLFSTTVEADWHGSVYFYTSINFASHLYPIDISETQRCFNVGCFHPKTISSVK
jgi:hypothetical protein